MHDDTRVIWITGASSGIGAALAVAFSQRGARLVLSARRADELEKVRVRCQRPEQHLVLPLDMAGGDFASATAEVLARFGRIDVLVNNAGISQRSRVEDTVLAVDRRLMEVNYFGVVGLTKAVLPVMQKQNGGQFVVISSLVGLVSTPYRSTYAATKHALHGFFEALRAEEYDHGIRVLMVCPGGIATEVSVNALSGDGSAHGVMDPLQEKGLSADECARQVIVALDRGKAQVIVAGREGLVAPLYRFFPSIYRRLVRRLKVT